MEGLGVLINRLGGNAETATAWQSAKGKEIRHVELKDDALLFTFTDGSQLSVWDDGQSCCEKRYMVCHDDLKEFAGAKLLDFNEKNAPEIESPWGTHEVQFLDVVTSRGTFQVATHNEHNGYYGGFFLRLSYQGGAQG
jgi:hypothetical protein